MSRVMANHQAPIEDFADLQYRITLAASSSKGYRKSVVAIITFHSVNGFGTVAAFEVKDGDKTYYHDRFVDALAVYNMVDGKSDNSLT